MTLSAVIFKKKLPIETCGQTSKFMHRTLSKFAGETVLKSSDCVTAKIRIPVDHLTSEFFVSH